MPSAEPRGQIDPNLAANALTVVTETTDPFRRRAAALLLRLVASRQEPISSLAMGRFLDAVAAAPDVYMHEVAVDLLEKRLSREDQELLPRLERLAAEVRGDQAARLIDAIGKLGPPAVPLLCRLMIGTSLPRTSTALQDAAQGDPASIEVILNACLGRSEADIDRVIQSLGTIDPNYTVTRKFLQRAEPETDPASLVQLAR